MSLGTAGCVQDACRRLRDVAREMEGIGARRTYVRIFDARAEPSFEIFPCRQLCMECRYLADPPSRDPMRSDPGASRLPACPNCGSVAWVDLRNTDAPELVDNVDASDRAQRLRKIRTRIVRAGLGIVGIGLVLVVVSLVLGGASVADAVFEVAFPSLIAAPVAAIGLGGLSTGFSVTAKPRTTAARWRLPAPKAPAKKGTKTRGALIAAETLRAPLTGRPCIGYEIGIRHNAKPNARDATWLLLEQACAPFRIGSAAVTKDGAYLRLHRTELDRANITLDSEALSQFLRMRALNPSTRYTFFETILTADQPARLFAGKPAGVAVLVG